MLQTDLLTCDLIATTIQHIINYLPTYHQFINQQKTDGTIILGYARKSPGAEAKEVRTRLLKTMIHKLKERSLVHDVYVSLSSKSYDRIVDRDNDIKEVIDGSAGTTMGKLNIVERRQAETNLMSF